jgi:hypothetical protein
MRTFKTLLLLLCVIVFSQALKANCGDRDKKKLPEGLLHGYIIDAETKKPLSGVSVSLSSRNQADKEIVSDAAGYFNFGKIPAGDLTLLFGKKGYKFYRRNALALKEGTTVKMSVEVQPESEAADTWNPLFHFLKE